jgi:hypothetical protein
VRLVELHTVPVDGGFYIYHDDWDDDRVAREATGAGKPLNKGHVKTVRENCDPARPLVQRHETTTTSTLRQLIEKHNRLAAMVAPLDETLLIKGVK